MPGWRAGWRWWRRSDSAEKVSKQVPWPLNPGSPTFATSSNRRYMMIRGGLIVCVAGTTGPEFSWLRNGSYRSSDRGMVWVLYGNIHPNRRPAALVNLRHHRPVIIAKHRLSTTG